MIPRMKGFRSFLGIGGVSAFCFAAGPAPSPPKVGERPPDFTLSGLDGRKVTLSEAKGRPVVLAFYRGHW